MRGGLTWVTRERNPLGSIEEAVQFLAQPPEDAGLGGVNGSDADPKRPGHFRTWPAQRDVLPEYFPGLLFKFGLHQAQRPADEIVPVFRLRQRIHRRRGITAQLVDVVAQRGDR